MLQVGLSVQEEDPRSLPLAARFSPAPGTLLQHSLHHVLAQESSATSTTPDAVSGLAGVSHRGFGCHCRFCWQGICSTADHCRAAQAAGQLCETFRSTNPTGVRLLQQTSKAI